MACPALRWVPGTRQDGAREAMWRERTDTSLALGELQSGGRLTCPGLAPTEGKLPRGMCHGERVLEAPESPRGSPWPGGGRVRKTPSTPLSLISSRHPLCARGRTCSGNIPWDPPFFLAGAPNQKPERPAQVPTICPVPLQSRCSHPGTNRAADLGELGPREAPGCR